jgi:hypothetical protein
MSSVLSSCPIIPISAHGTIWHLAIWIKPSHLEHGSNLVPEKGSPFFIDRIIEQKYSTENPTLVGFGSTPPPSARMEREIRLCWQGTVEPFKTTEKIAVLFFNIPSAIKIVTGVFRVLLHEEKKPRPPAIFNLASLTMQILPPTPRLLYNDVFNMLRLVLPCYKDCLLDEIRVRICKAYKEPRIDHGESIPGSSLWFNSFPPPSLCE